LIVTDFVPLLAGVSAMAPSARKLLCFMMTGLALLWAVTAASAQEQGAENPASAPGADTTAADANSSAAGDESGAAPAGPSPQRIPAANEQQRRVVTAGMLLLVGIAFVGLLLVGLTIVWGSRVRRLARRPLPEQSPVDELWYLKPKKPMLDDGADAAGATDDRAATKRDDPSESS